jgi:hypothetical protein
MKYYLVCPYCKEEFGFRVKPPHSDYDPECEACGKVFSAYIVKIRAKRSRGNKRRRSRDFSIRVVTLAGREDFLEFSNASYEDFELRKGDMAGFFFVNEQLRVVQNFTIGEVYFISRSSCYLASYVYGAESEEVAILRGFRDEVLVPCRPLSFLVRAYYRVSPQLIRRCGDSVVCKWFIWMCVATIVWALRQRRRAGAQSCAATSRLRD